MSSQNWTDVFYQKQTFSEMYQKSLTHHTAAIFPLGKPLSCSLGWIIGFQTAHIFAGRIQSFSSIGRNMSKLANATLYRSLSWFRGAWPVNEVIFPFVQKVFSVYSGWTNLFLTHEVIQQSDKYLVMFSIFLLVQISYSSSSKHCQEA